MNTTGVHLITATVDNLFTQLGSPARMSELPHYDLLHPGSKP